MKKSVEQKQTSTKVKPKSKESKKEARKKFMEMAPVFRIKPLGVDSSMCKYLGNIENSDKLTDELIEFDKKEDSTYGKSTIKLYDIGKYEILLKVCACNIIGNYILKNKKIPAYYVTMVYSNQLVSGQLFTLFLYFTIDEKTSKELILPKHYMYGSYTLELSADDGFIDFMMNKLTPELSEKIMEAFVDEFDKANDDEKEILNEIVSNQLESELNIYKKMFDPINVTKPPSRSHIIKVMENFMRDEKIKRLAEIAIELREKDRRERMCPDQTFEPPKKVLNLREFRDHPEKLEEYLDNLSNDSDDSDNSSI